MSDQRILCVGMCVLDIIHNCEQYPEEDTDKRCIQGYWQRGGNASNNCTVLRQLGANCEFLGMLSSSTTFQFLLHDIHKRDINITNCPSTTQDPPFSSVILAQNTGTRTIIHSNMQFPILTHAHFQKLFLNNYSWIHFEARNFRQTQAMLQDISRFNAQQRLSAHIIVSLELEKKQTELVELAAYANYVFISKDFAEHMGWTSLEKAAFGLRAIIPQSETSVAIICTWGAHGCACLDALNNYVQLPSQQVDVVVDSLGAGDTFCAATIYALQHLKMSLPKAMEFGNNCAAYKLKHRGYDDIKKFQKNFK